MTEELLEEKKNQGEEIDSLNRKIEEKVEEIRLLVIDKAELERLKVKHQETIKQLSANVQHLQEQNTQLAEGKISIEQAHSKCM